MNKESLHPFWTLISTLIISIGAGHGVAPVVVIQFFMIFNFNETDQIWFIPTIIFFFGQALLLTSLFTEKRKKVYYFTGSGVILSGILFLIFIGMEDYSSEIPTLITMVPFLSLVIISLIKAGIASDKG
ncbi:MAG: hypothetical protein RIE52_11745 [Balneola sp.]|jgi:peptidoglycan/LPS O-acetylase OafA/YrhL